MKAFLANAGNPGDISDAPSSSKPREAFWAIQRWGGLFLLLCVAGCTSLPSVGPFVDASNRLRSAVFSSGTAVEAELRLMSGGSDAAEKLKTHWNARNQAFAAAAAYASSLQAIVAAGDEGAASAQRVAESVNALAGASGIALPGSPAAMLTATDIGRFIYSQVALVRASKSLQKALEAAQPAIEEISRRVSAKTDAADTKLAEKIQVTINIIEELRTSVAKRI